MPMCAQCQKNDYYGEIKNCSNCKKYVCTSCIYKYGKELYCPSCGSNI